MFEYIVSLASYKILNDGAKKWKGVFLNIWNLQFKDYLTYLTDHFALNKYHNIVLYIAFLRIAFIYVVIYVLFCILDIYSV